MVFSRNPPLLHQATDTPPELSPIFSFLNIHTNKVYQEGYFLKLNDLDSGRLTGYLCGELTNKCSWSTLW
jgi:CCR4-NOT transcriptional complex subunit CAF120